MSSGHARLARFVVRCYPRAWRARYEAEMLALIDDRPIGLWQTADLTRSCAGHWLQELGRRLRAALAPGSRFDRAVRWLPAGGGSRLVALFAFSFFTVRVRRHVRAEWPGFAPSPESTWWAAAILAVLAAFVMVRQVPGWWRRLKTIMADPDGPEPGYPQSLSRLEVVAIWVMTIGCTVWLDLAGSDVWIQYFVMVLMLDEWPVRPQPSPVAPVVPGSRDRN